MSRESVRVYFSEYVFGFMRGDVEREVRLARQGDGGGNFLAALGLLAYTEAVGRIRVRNFPDRAFDGQSCNERSCNACFDLMGSRYRPTRVRFRQLTGRSVYTVFRHGMAHEYFPKIDTTVVMLGKPRVAIRLQRDETCVFFVEAYLSHFLGAARRIRRELLALPDPTIPLPDSRSQRRRQSPERRPR